MGSPDDLEPRVSSLESQMREVRQDVVDVRTLASGTDRDVSTLATRADADRRLMTALRETQIEHGQRLGKLESVVRAGFTAVLARLGTLEAGHTSLLGGQASLEGRQASLETRLETGLAGLEGRQASLETRLETGLASLEGRQASLEAGQERLETGQAMILDLLRRRNGHDEAPPASAE